MKRKLALASVAVTALLVLTACGNGAVTENTTSGVGIPEITVEPTAGDETATPTPQPTFNAEGEVIVPTQPAQRTEISYEEDNSQIVEMDVDEVLHIVGLPQDDMETAIYVESTPAEQVGIQQRESTENGAQTDPTLTGLKPGMTNIRVYDTNPTGNNKRKIMEFTLSVKNFDDESIIANLPPVAAQILVSNMRVGDAVVAAENAGFEVRLVEIDGVSRPVTMDYREDRLNLSVKNGAVVGVTQG